MATSPELGPVGAPRLWRWGDAPQVVESFLRSGGIVAIPTESTYGLASLADHRLGVEAIFRFKRRPPTRPLPVVGATAEALVDFGVTLDGPLAQRVRAAWPAALTLVAPYRGDAAAACGEDTLAVRVPAHAQLRGLLSDLDVVLTATSANRTGELPATTVESVVELLAGVEALVIDDGELPGGAPSTLVVAHGRNFEVLREGRFPSQGLVGDA